MFDATTLEGYFSTNVESVRKDVECVFGILKKQWRILDHGFKSCSMAHNDQIFVTCCVLHKMMFNVMENERRALRVGQGVPIGNSGVWLDGHTDPPRVNVNNKEQSDG
jgi:hypothetical protein